MDISTSKCTYTGMKQLHLLLAFSHWVIYIFANKMSAIKYKLKQLCEERNQREVRAREKAGKINEGAAAAATSTLIAFCILQIHEQSSDSDWDTRGAKTQRYIRNHNSYFSFFRSVVVPLADLWSVWQGRGRISCGTVQRGAEMSKCINI